MRRGASLSPVGKVLTAPFRALATMLTALIAARIFELVWRLLTRGKPLPDEAEDRAGAITLIAASALRSASKAATREVIDTAGRKTSSHLFGSGGRSATVPPAHPKASARAEAEARAKGRKARRGRKSA